MVRNGGQEATASPNCRHCRFVQWWQSGANLPCRCDLLRQRVHLPYDTAPRTFGSLECNHAECNHRPVTLCAPQALPSSRGRREGQTFSPCTHLRSLCFFPALSFLFQVGAKSPGFQFWNGDFSSGLLCQLLSSDHVGPSSVPHRLCPLLPLALSLDLENFPFTVFSWLPLFLHISIRLSPTGEGFP